MIKRNNNNENKCTKSKSGKQDNRKSMKGNEGVRLPTQTIMEKEIRFYYLNYLKSNEMELNKI